MPDVTPLFTKRDPVTGAVLFDFDGHINAEGIDFVANQSLTYTAPPKGTIQWHRDTTDGARVAEIQGSGSGVGSGGMYLRAVAPADAEAADLLSEASSGGGATPYQGARLALHKKPSAGTTNAQDTNIVAEVQLNPGGVNYQTTLVDGLGRSSFLRVGNLIGIGGNPIIRKATFGTTDSGGWGVTPNRSFAISHGGNVAPSHIIATATTANSTASATDPVICAIQAIAATTFTVFLRTGLGGNCNFPGVFVHWMAIWNTAF